MLAEKIIQPTTHSTIVDPRELVSDKLLKDIRGEVLLIRTYQGTTICSQLADKMLQQALSWLLLAGDELKTNGFIAGYVSEKGGKFAIINRDQAVELIAIWIFEGMRNELG